MHKGSDYMLISVPLLKASIFKVEIEKKKILNKYWEFSISSCSAIIPHYLSPFFLEY